MKEKQGEVLITKEQREPLELLEDLSFTWEISTGQFATITGRDAMDSICKMICLDKIIYKNIAISRKVENYKKQKMEVEFLGFHCKKEIVYGKLNFGNQSSITDSLRYLRGTLTEAEKRALSQLEKLEEIYLKYQKRRIKNELKRTVEVVPDLIVYSYMQKPGAGAPYENLYNYYKIFVELNQPDPTADYDLSVIIPSIVKAMQDDGRTKPQIIRALEAGGIEQAREKVNQLASKTEKKRKL